MLGGEVEPPPDGTGPPATALPADFPLISGWPEDDGSERVPADPASIDNQAMIPAGELARVRRLRRRTRARSSG